MRVSTDGSRKHDDSYVTRASRETMAMCDHRFLSGQLCGFAGSSGPSQSTTLGSSSLLPTSFAIAMVDLPDSSSGGPVAFSELDLRSADMIK